MEDIQFVIDSFEELKLLLCSLLGKTNFEGLGEQDKKELLQHFDIAIKALEKQIAKKPKIMNKPLGREKFWWYCGHCGASRHTGSKAHYCGYCGGKVDWD